MSGKNPTAFNLPYPSVASGIEAVNVVERAMQDHGEIGELICTAESQLEWDAGDSAATLAINVEGCFTRGDIREMSVSAMRNLSRRLEAACVQIETWPRG